MRNLNWMVEEGGAMDLFKLSEGEFKNTTIIAKSGEGMSAFFVALAKEHIGAGGGYMIIDRSPTNNNTNTSIGEVTK